MNDYSGMYTALSEFSALVKSNEVQKSALELSRIISANAKVSKEFSNAIREYSSVYSKQAKALSEQLRIIMAENTNYSEYAINVLKNALEYYKTHPVEKPDFNSHTSPNSASTKSDAIPTIDLQMFAESADDYVIVDETLVKEWDITESVTVSVGNNRVKMKTSDFIQLLFLIFTALSFTITFIVGRIDAASEAETSNQKINIEQERNELMKEQNQMLYEFLSSIDASESSQTEAIEELKESVLNLHSDFLELSESVPSRSDVSLTQDSVPSSHKSDSNLAPETRNSNLE